MLIAKQELLNYLSITNGEANVKLIRIIEPKDTKNLDIINRTVEIVFTDNIVPYTNGFTDTISLSESDLDKFFTIQIKTFCSLANKLEEDFNPDECEEGDLEFNVSLNWLIDTLNSDSKYLPTGFSETTINNIEDLSEWLKEYTHYEGEHIYRKALNQNMIIGETTIANCKYCLNNKL